jgi:hypothetical protein
VGGDRVVLAWVAAPSVTCGQMSDMTRTVESIRFVDPG